MPQAVQLIFILRVVKERILKCIGYRHLKPAEDARAAEIREEDRTHDDNAISIFHTNGIILI
jgi:hypothetical protein